MPLLRPSAGVAKETGLPSIAYVSCAGRLVASQDLHQGRLARTLDAHEADDLAEPHLERGSSPRLPRRTSRCPPTGSGRLPALPPCHPHPPQQTAIAGNVGGIVERRATSVSGAARRS